MLAGQDLFQTDRWWHDDSEADPWRKRSSCSSIPGLVKSTAKNMFRLPLKRRGMLIDSARRRWSLRDSEILLPNWAKWKSVCSFVQQG